MSVPLPMLDSPGDAELISAVRGGDADAYGELFARHVEAARRLGRQLVAGPDVDDLVAEAFAKVFGVLRRGGGPDLAFRAYLLTAVRRLHVDRLRVAARLQTTDDPTPFDPGIPFRDTAVEGFESLTVARAFASLPERWQVVLWHTEVEGQKPAEVGRLLGMSPNSVSALAYRAREGLRQAFLSMHARETEHDACTWTREHLGPYLRSAVSRRDRSRIETHLAECRPCAAIYLELADVNADLAGLLAPVLLGGAAAAYVASSGGATASGGLLLLLDRARELVLGHAPATAAVGVGALVVGGVLLAVRVPEQHPPPSPPEAAAPQAVREDLPARPARPDGPRPRGGHHHGGTPTPSPPEPEPRRVAAAVPPPARPTVRPPDRVAKPAAARPAKPAAARLTAAVPAPAPEPASAPEPAPQAPATPRPTPPPPAPAQPSTPPPEPAEPTPPPPAPAQPSAPREPDGRTSLRLEATASASDKEVSVRARVSASAREDTATQSRGFTGPPHGVGR